jgi:predicted Zn-dependent protease
MPLLTASQARAILQKTLGFAKADECQVSLTGSKRGNLRFARNTVSTSGGSNQSSLSIRCSLGSRTGATTTNEFDDASLQRAVRQAEELARLSPENPEHVEQVGPQTFLEPNSFFPSTANLTQEDRVKAAAASIDLCREKKLTAAGYLSDSAGFSAIANSKGLSGYQQNTQVDFSVTTRTDDGRGSGYGIADFDDVKQLDTAALTRVAVQKALASREARAIEPGKYTVILEPSAGVTLISNMLNAMDARPADEGRSFLSKAGGGNRVGEKMMDERVNLFTDPMNPELPGRKWSADGRATRRVDWIQGGVIKNMGYTRHWARKKGLGDKAPPPTTGAGAILGGTNASLEDLIKGVKRGVLVTRLWYIRLVDAQTLLYTGLTRDGTFYVENGEIKYAVKNFRFNESPVIMLNNIEALGRPQRVSNCLIPPMVVRDFTFSSLSDAV